METQRWMERSRAPLCLIRFTYSHRSRMSCLRRSRQRRATPQTEVDLMQLRYQIFRGKSTSVAVACCFNTCPTVPACSPVAPTSCRDPENKGMCTEPRLGWKKQTKSLRNAPVETFRTMRESMSSRVMRVIVLSVSNSPTLHTRSSLNPTLID